MKFLAGVVIVSVVLTVQLQAHDQYYRECVSTTGVDEGLTTKVPFRSEVPDDPKLKQFVHCLSKKMGFQDRCGLLQPDVIRRTLVRDLGPQIAEEVIETCTDAKRADASETAFQFYKCYRNVLAEPQSPCLKKIC